MTKEAQLRELKMKWTGLRPLIMHSSAMVDPLNPFKAEIGDITEKGSKKLTNADRQRIHFLEWRGSLYWDDELGLYVPSENVEKCIREGAAKSRLGKQVESTLLVQELKIPIRTPTKARTPEKLYEDTAYHLRMAVRIPPRTGARIMKMRPMIPTGWSIAFTIEFDEEVVNETQLVKACVMAGTFVGIGDWRPKFGRFTVE